MPTAYTSKIKDGISFEDFALTCSRAFGALVHLKDDFTAEIPDKVEPYDFHKEEIEKELGRLKKLSDKEVVTEIEREFAETIKTNEARIKEVHELRASYNKMLRYVEEWVPPTKDHQGLKGFMKEQIRLSLDFDCWLCDEEITKLTPEKWISNKIKKALKDLKHHKEEWSKEVNRAYESTVWIRKLKESLKWKYS